MPWHMDFKFARTGLASELIYLSYLCLMKVVFGNRDIKRILTLLRAVRLQVRHHGAQRPDDFFQRHTLRPVRRVGAAAVLTPLPIEQLDVLREDGVTNFLVFKPTARDDCPDLIIQFKKPQWAILAALAMQESVQVGTHKLPFRSARYKIGPYSTFIVENVPRQSTIIGGCPPAASSLIAQLLEDDFVRHGNARDCHKINLVFWRAWKSRRVAPASVVMKAAYMSHHCALLSPWQGC